MERKRGKTLRGGAREIIANVIKICEEEAINQCLKLPLISKTQRAAMYTNVSESTIKRIKNEDQHRRLQNPGGSLESPGKKRPRLSVVEKVDDFDFAVIRRTIEDFYLNLKQIPSCEKLLEAIQEKMFFPFGRKTLNKLLKVHGFHWRKCKSNRRLLIEKPAILDWRLTYLRTIKRHRKEKQNIIYIDETWVDNGMTVNKCWQNEEVFEDLGSNISSTGRLIVVNAGSSQGFVAGAGLIFRAGASTGDYHGQMNKENFEKWLHEYLFPNIPPGTVIVMDNAPYHSEIIDKGLTKHSTKSVMISWLEKNNIIHDPSSRKADLYALITANKPTEKKCRIDKIIWENGHIPLRLPPYMCELNPIVLAWADVKNYMKNHNTTGALSSKDLEKLTNNAIASITAKNWEEYLKHIISIEDEYWENDAAIEEAVDEIIMNLGESTSDIEYSDESDGSN